MRHFDNTVESKQSHVTGVAIVIVIVHLQLQIYF